MKHALLIAIIALACGVGGYTIGRRTAPMPFETARTNMYEARRSLAVKIGKKRETVGRMKKPASERRPPRRRRRPATKPAAKKPTATTKASRGR